MVVLLRLTGIPTRVVSGYSYAFPFESQDEYSVNSSCAHMWPEAYIEGFGWMPFAHTSSYRTFDEYTQHTRIKKDNPLKQDVSLGTGIYTYDTSYSSSSSSTEDATAAEEAVPDRVQFIRIALPVALSIIGILILLIFVAATTRQLRYLLGTPEKKLSIDVEIIKKNIRKKCDTPFIDRGLLSDYVQRAPDEMKDDLKKVFASYYKMMYAKKSLKVSQEEINLAKKVREKL